MSPQKKLPFISHKEQILLTGSCFTEHMSARLKATKFKTLANPHGVLFNPMSVFKDLEACLEQKKYKKSDLFFENETWNSWDFHSRFSHTDATTALNQMNESVQRAGVFLKQTDWLIVTLGSAFQYFLKGGNPAEAALPVSNCHRVPAPAFEKRLLTVEEMVLEFESLFARIKKENSGIKILFTISPVRHIRDGVVENNRSKARLIEMVNRLMEAHPDFMYFPAYELLIDVLRDYRFYDVDMVHPNYQATQYIWEQFELSFFSPETRQLIGEIRDVQIAFNHKPRFPETQAHQKFKASYLDKVKQMRQQHPGLDFEEEVAWFSSGA